VSVVHAGPGEPRFLAPPSGCTSFWGGRGPGVVAVLDPRLPSGTPLGSVVPGSNGWRARRWLGAVAPCRGCRLIPIGAMFLAPASGCWRIGWGVDRGWSLRSTPGALLGPRWGRSWRGLGTRLPVLCESTDGIP